MQTLPARRGIMDDTKPKRTSSKQAIVQAMVTLLQTQSSEDIRVKDLITEAGIARSLFYYHFESVNDVLELMITDFVDGFTQTLVDAFPATLTSPPARTDADTMQEQNIASFRYIYNNKDIYWSLSRDAFAAPSFRNRLRRGMIWAYEQCDFLFTDKAGNRCMLNRREAEYFVESFVWRHMGVIECWSNRQFAETPEELYAMEMVLDHLNHAPQIVRRQRYANYGAVRNASWQDFA